MRPAEGSAMTSSYRPDIDGLRAIAVLAVLGFHAFPRLCPGGFVGVDIFFVISGYLISKIIFDDAASGKFTYRGFYSRRIRRIFPSLVIVLLAVLVAGLLLDFFTEFSRLGSEVTAGAAFLSNVWFWHESNYFDTDAIYKPVLHLWSLGVEEQFYIVWPLMIAALSGRRVLWVAVAVLLVSLATNIAIVRSQPAAAFFLPVTRFWELMIGALLAYSAHARSREPQHQDALSGVGFILLVLSLVLINKDLAFPGWFALIPTLGAAALIGAGPTAWLNRTLLANKPAVFVGLISYPLYLWHWPVLSFMTLSQGELSRGLSLAAVGVSFALAYATYVLVEKPLRFGESGTFKVAGLSAALVILGIAGIVLPSWLDLDDRSAFVAWFENSAPVHKYATAHGLSLLWRDECNFGDLVSNAAKPSISPQCTAGSGRRVMLWGDSHMQHLAPGLKATVPPQALLLQIATSGCPPSLHRTSSDPDSPCNRSNAFALQTIERIQPDVVIVAQRDLHETKDWTELARSVKAHGAKAVLLLGPVPQWQQPLHAIIARHFWPNPPERLDTWLTAGPFETDRLLKQRYKGSSDLRYVSIIEGLCNAEGCLTRVGPDLFEDIEAFDYGHLTPSSSKYVAERVVTPAVLEVLHDNGSTAIRTGSSELDR
jgi:peptidoglycan/LPS O-acetylase OafA/YrhL